MWTAIQDGNRVYAFCVGEDNRLHRLERRQIETRLKTLNPDNCPSRADYEAIKAKFELALHVIDDFQKDRA